MNTYKVGDKVRITSGDHFEVGDVVTVVENDGTNHMPILCEKVGEKHKLWLHLSDVEPYSDGKPKTWGKMTDAQKGALLLAAHEGKVIEVFCCDHDWSGWNEKPSPIWNPSRAYRVKTEPKRETVTLYGHGSYWGIRRNPHDTHSLTYETLDGEPDADSIKMERI